MYSKILKCRGCQSENIRSVLDLGEQTLSGVFRSINLDGIISGPLALVSCKECTLVQLEHSYPLGEMYNEGYGYRSGVTKYMTLHLKGILDFALSKVELRPGSYVLDIGSNDGTLLAQYRGDGIAKIGIDPVAKKYLHLYPKEAKVVTEFFDEKAYFGLPKKRHRL